MKNFNDSFVLCVLEESAYITSGLKPYLKYFFANFSPNISLCCSPILVNFPL